jgi:hypothetical protein
MADLSAIPPKMMVRVELLAEDLLELEVREFLFSYCSTAETPSATVNQGNLEIEMTYADWELALAGLTKRIVSQLTDDGGLPKEALCRLKNAIGNTLIGLQEERIQRLYQGES